MLTHKNELGFSQDLIGLLKGDGVSSMLPSEASPLSAPRGHCLDILVDLNLFWIHLCVVDNGSSFLVNYDLSFKKIKYIKTLE